MLDVFINKKGTKPFFKYPKIGEYPNKQDKITLLISEEEKYENDKERLKRIIENYEDIGEEQIAKRSKKFRKLWDIAKGIIDPTDYVEVEKNIFDNTVDALDVNIKFYPIITPILDLLLAKVDKMFSIYEARAVDETATNELLEMRNNMLRESLIQSVRYMFDLDTQQQLNQVTESQEFQTISQEEQKTQIDNFIQKRQELFQTMPKVQDYMSAEWRSSVEEWANAVIQVHNSKFDIKKLERDVFESIFITDYPVVHVGLLNNSYYVEKWNEENVFELRSPETDDLCDAVMVGRFDYLNFGTVLNKYGAMLKPEDVEVLEYWTNTFNGFHNLLNNNQNAFFTGNKTEIFDSLNNTIVFDRMKSKTLGGQYNGEGLSNQNLVRETTMYFLVPRKVGYVTFKFGENVIKEKVDEFYKVTYKPKYNTRVKEYQNEYTLVEGEHIDWVYENELYKCIKIRLDDVYLPVNSSNNNLNDKFKQPIYVFLDKCPLQYKSRNMSYGIKIPVHGGSKTYLKKGTYSATERMENFQILYNYLYNRVDELLRTEIGEFMTLDQNEIPKESMGESWGKDPLKALQVAHDTGILPLDRSLNNMGQSTASGALGQVINLNRTKDVTEKIQLANLFKQECYSVMGITPQMLAQLTPYMTATAAKQGMQQSTDQIQYLFTRLNDIMKSVLETVVETCQYLTSIGELKELTYVTPENVKHIFKLPQYQLDKLSIYDLGIFIRNDIRDNEILENLKQLALTDNTMGADSLEKATIFTSPTVSTLLNKLEKIKKNKEREVEQQRQFEAQQQQQLIDSQNQQLESDLQYKREKDRLDRETEIEVAKIRALGYANDTADEIRQQIIKIQEGIGSKGTNDVAKTKLAELNLKRSESVYKQDQANNEILLKNKELDIRRQEVEATEKRTRAMLRQKQIDKNKK